MMQGAGLMPVERTGPLAKQILQECMWVCPRRCFKIEAAARECIATNADTYFR